MTSADIIPVERPTTNSRIFAQTRWDVLPALAGLFHLFYFFALFYLYPRTSLWIMLPLGFLYSLMINANINGVGHNFIHNPFFRSPLLNRLFGLTQSIACCFSQTYYNAVHMQHHKGNSDRQDEHGETIDWLSIYRHGHEGEAENPWSYVFLSYFRDNPAAIRRELKKRNNADHIWGNIELAAFIVTLIVLGFFNWRYVVFYFLPFYYLGHCFSYLNGYFRHYGADPDTRDRAMRVESFSHCRRAACPSGKAAWACGDNERGDGRARHWHGGISPCAGKSVPGCGTGGAGPAAAGRPGGGWSGVDL